MSGEKIQDTIISMEKALEKETDENLLVCYWLIKKAQRYFLAGMVEKTTMHAMLEQAVRGEVDKLGIMVGRL